MASIAAALARIKQDPLGVIDRVAVEALCDEMHYDWRERQLDPAVTVALFVQQVIAGNVPCSEVHHLAAEGFTASAWCQARARLPLEVYQGMLTRVCDLALPRTREKQHLWHGHRTFHVDGSTYSMPDTKELRQAFGTPHGPAPGCAFPVAHLLVMFSAATGLLIDAMAAPLQPSRDEMQELLELAIEGRRRVKEQLKKMSPHEFHQTSFSYQLKETGEERFVGVPEQGGRDMISSDPPAPGCVYAAAMDGSGNAGLYRIEVNASHGTGKLKTAGGLSGAMRESVNRAFGYMLSKKTELGLGKDLDNADLHVEVIDLLNNRVEGEVGIAFFVAAMSALRKTPVTAATLVIGDMSIHGNIKAAKSLTEPLQIAMDNGAKRALIPIENKRLFLEVSADIVEKVDPVFYGDPRAAATKAMGLT